MTKLLEKIKTNRADSRHLIVIRHDHYLLSCQCLYKYGQYLAKSELAFKICSLDDIKNKK